MDEAVLDVEEMPIVPEEDQPLPVGHKVVFAEDLVGKKASICYNDNLLSLARYMIRKMNTYMSYSYSVIWS